MHRDFSRQMEIFNWRRDNDYKGDWVALDDDEGFHSSCENLIACDGMVGLTERELAELRRRLAQ